MSFWGKLVDAARELASDLVEATEIEPDADGALMAAMAAAIEIEGTRYALDPSPRWEPGRPLKVLFAGYAGSRNTGADVRVEELIRQVRFLLGDEHLELSITTIDPDETAQYFAPARQLHIPKIYPAWLARHVREVDAVITVEGSMFKSKFANALSTMMVGALALATVQDKLAVGYGGEAGTMDPALEKLIRRYLKDAYVIGRNPASQRILHRLGVRADAGTDTAWTFEPAPPEEGAQVLRDAGWDGTTPLLIVAPINPFWWPVKPNVAKGVAHAITGLHADSHFDSVLFHEAGDHVDTAQATYLDALAQGIGRFGREHPVFPVCFGSEQLDRQACEDLAERLADLFGHDVPCIVSDHYDMWTMVSVVRHARYLVSSRYHAIVTSMPGGVPSVGVTMDERIRNLMADRGTPELALEHVDPELAERLHAALVRLHDDADELVPGIERTVVRNLERMGHMGALFIDHVREQLPDFPVREGLGTAADPWAHLPPLSEELRAMVGRHRPGSAS